MTTGGPQHEPETRLANILTEIKSASASLEARDARVRALEGSVNDLLRRVGRPSGNARRTPDIWIDGTRVPVTWDEPMPGVGRPWFECRRAVDVAGTRTYGRRSLAGDVTVFSMQFDTCGGRCQASSAVAMCGRSRRYRHAGEAAAALITISSSR
jgi:hypothetical protein